MPRKLSPRQRRRRERLDRRRTAFRSARGIALPRDQVLFVAADDLVVLRAHLGDGYPVRSGGYGGWEDVPRPGQVSATVYRGPEPQQLHIPVVLGGWPVQPPWADCDRDWRTLEQLGRQPVHSARGDHPPLLRIRGRVPHGGVRWVVEDVQWGDDGIVARGELVRISATVVLRRFVPVELVQRPRRTGGRRYRPYTVRRGRGRHGSERLAGILRRELRADGSREVARLRRLVLRINRLRDPQSIRPGQRILLPRRPRRGSR